MENNLYINSEYIIHTWIKDLSLKVILVNTLSKIWEHKRNKSTYKSELRFILKLRHCSYVLKKISFKCRAKFWTHWWIVNHPVQQYLHFAWDSPCAPKFYKLSNLSTSLALPWPLTLYQRNKSLGSEPRDLGGLSRGTVMAMQFHGE